jgi:hypothetical protein
VAAARRPPPPGIADHEVFALDLGAHAAVFQ